MRHRRYIAYILVTVLCLGVIAPGLLGVFPNVAIAGEETIEFDPGETLYWEDFKDYVYSIASSSQVTDLNTIFTYCNTWWDVSEGYDVNIFVIFEDSDNFTFLVCTWGPTYTNSIWGLAYYDNFTPSYCQLRTLNTYDPSTNVYISTRGSFKVVNGVVTNVSTIRSTETIPYRYSHLDISTSTDPFEWYVCQYDYNYYRTYVLRDLIHIGSISSGAISKSANIAAGHKPAAEGFDGLTFYLGQQLYFTSNKQLLMARMDPETMGFTLSLGFSKVVPTGVETQYFDFTDAQRVQIAYPGDVINSIIDTVPVGGIYAVNITGILSQGFDQIFDAEFVDLEEDILYAQATNTPIMLSSEEQQETQDNINTWNTFNEYHNTYNTTHVIPQSLGDTLFGLNGSQIYPCNVMVPRSVWQNSPDNDGGTSFADAPTWLWWFPLIPDNLGFNYNLLDTIILSESSTGEYSVLYWYDDNLTKKFLKVKDQNFEDILQEFDCIIIVPDDDGCLRASTWWRDTLAAICSGLGIDTPSLLNSLAMCGSSSLGVEYVEDMPDAEHRTHILQGYALLTPKAIQKQMLWNFNDGITKLYQLEVDYIESEDKWKDSFLLWSSSVFYAIDSLGGKLDSLIAKLGNIEGKLDRLIQNTSEDESSYWFISLWNWVVQFNPSDNDFANSLQQYDNNWNNMPSLPPPSPLPMLPGGE